MRVAACQLPDIRNDLRRAMSLIEMHALHAWRDGADLVCFPECFLQGYDLHPERVAEAALELSSSAFDRVLEEFEPLEPVMVVGLIEREAGRFYNTAVAIERGRVIARYRKTHLLKGEQSIFQPGEESPVFDVAGVKVAINICYDLCFAESARRAAAAGAELLACPCSNMMPRKTAEEWKLRHNEIRSRRAQEQGLWIVSSDIVGVRDDRISYGPTAVIDPNGAIVGQVPLSETGIVVTEISSRPASSRAPPSRRRAAR
jgi:predicted amidohydrolase